MPGRIFFHEDENGVKHDIEHLSEFLNDDDANLTSTLLVIRDNVEDGGSLEEALSLFGTAEMQAAYASGELTFADINAALAD